MVDRYGVSESDMDSQGNRPKHHIKLLTGVRGFAVLLVLCSHAGHSNYYLHSAFDFSGAGRYGVFLFFVLSAFLLTL
jgi:peptidoglycan/LPS O-acetylase OafA/YrhL